MRLHAALEALLLWALKQPDQPVPTQKNLDTLPLVELVALAKGAGRISQSCAEQAGLARDARNLIHPGKALRSGQACSRATALTALAAVYRVAEDLDRRGTETP